MIIEDEKDLCYLLSAVLRSNHLQTACVYSIKEARKSLHEIRPSVIFLDNHLPDGYGSDLIGTVRANYPDTKIIMITAHDSADDIDKALRRGADYFISKPFTASTINNTLHLLSMEPSKTSRFHLTS